MHSHGALPAPFWAPSAPGAAGGHGRRCGHFFAHLCFVNIIFRYSRSLIRMSPRLLFSSQDSPREYKRTEHRSTHGAQSHRVRHAVRFQTRRGSLTCVHASSSASMLHTCSCCHSAIACIVVYSCARLGHCHGATPSPVSSSVLV